jgi:hypothetical protein
MCNKSRHFWKCPMCLTVAATEGDTISRLECGHCAVQMTYMGKVSQSRLTRTEHHCPCDARCTNASGPSCDCSCGGINHGTQALVTVTVDAGPIPVANVRPTAQALWDVKEYRTLRTELQNELARLQNDRSQYARARRICGALWKAASMTSHAGRMKHLRSVSTTDTKPQQASLFQ